MISTPEEHAFAPFIRILGKGKRGARSLTREEAKIAMQMILDGKCEDTQLGAFLMLLRHKEESPEELAGFTEAVRSRLPSSTIKVDIDWPSYAGKKRHLPWYLLAVKCLASNGIKILIHGGGAHTAGRLYSEELLETIGISRCQDWQAVATVLGRENVAFISLEQWMPALQRMINLRNTLGLRSPIHSLVRLLNPLNADCVLQSIFHPGYQPVHREASRLLQDKVIVIKGEGGEVELNPDSDAHLYGTQDGVAWDETWPALSERRHVKPEYLDPTHLNAVWKKEAQNEYGEMAVLSTMALALRGLGYKRDSAFSTARRYWDKR
ncbi:glycosyl transferase family protein [Pseudomonas duriflava]|uniref:glycosyl transferase family protein n=1 Tax=Pseudomonas duriflava TaxID=459528 RepID=UPI0011A42B15|nr:glycosyl transferase family protein [Pseudomonas duriflava]